MRFKLVALTASFSLLSLFSAASFATTVTLESTAAGGIYPYQMSINDSASYIAMSCLNDLRTNDIGEKWAVTVTNLGSLGSGGIDGATTAQLREDAYLDALYGTGTLGATNAEVQSAIWHVQDSSRTLDSKALILFNNAVSAQAGLSNAFLAQFTLYTPVVPAGDTNPTNPWNSTNPSDWDHNGEPQEFLQFTPTPLAATPEPSSLMLMGTGLTGMAGLLRRRKATRSSVC